MKTEKLDTDTLNEIRKLDTQIKSISNHVGVEYLRKIELERALDEVSKNIELLTSEYISLNKSLNRVVDSVKETYKSGTIDLKYGTVTYNEN